MVGWSSNEWNFTEFQSHGILVDEHENFKDFTVLLYIHTKNSTARSYFYIRLACQSITHNIYPEICLTLTMAIQEQTFDKIVTQPISIS